jgi:hypothetical protein
MKIAEKESAVRNNKTICLPFSQEFYIANIIDPIDFRKKQMTAVPNT